MKNLKNSLTMLVALFALTFAFGFAAPSEASAQFNRCSINGNVKDFNTAGNIHGVDVWTYNLYTDVAQQIDTTDVDGNYGFVIGGGTQVLVYLPTTPKWTFYSTSGSGTYRQVGCPASEWNFVFWGVDFYGHLN